MSSKLPLSSRSRRGFSLVELLAVIVILGILVAFLVTTLGGQSDAVKVNLTRTKVEQYAAEIATYERENGRFPQGTWKDDWGSPPNRINLGVEALVVQLWSVARGGTHLSEDDLVNLDADQSSSQLTAFPRRDLFELRDEWNNPLAYLERTQYGESFVYFTESPVTGEPIESQVKAVESAKTGAFHNPRSFQLLSAGPDGEFGTEDDIGNFRRE